jgi:DNA modification methylase
MIDYIQQGDCLELMKNIPDKSIDMILCDLPYGILNKSNANAKWDLVIDFDLLWKHYERLIKDSGAIVLFASGMFTADIMQSNRKLWRYNFVWDKVLKTGFLNAKKMPLRQHEDICVFYKKLPTYNPQMIKCEPHKRNHSKGNMKEPQKNSCYGNFVEVPTIISDEKYPTSIIKVAKEHVKGKFYHPTQKPVSLLEYLIKTYTNEGETVLDNCMGSGSTCVAAINTNRHYIGFELDPEYFEIAKQRIEDAQKSKEVSDVSCRRSRFNDCQRSG